MLVGGLSGRLIAAILFFVFVSCGAVDAATAPPLSAYGALPKTEEFALSPNGEMFARISTEGENRLLVVQKLNGEMITGGNVGTLKVAGLVWASDDHVIVYTHRTDRPNIDFETNWEYTQAVVVNVKTKKLSPLVQSTGNYFPALFGYFGFVKEADQWYAYVGLIPLEPGHQQGDGTLKQGYPDLYKIGLDSGTIKRVAFGSSYNRDWVIDEKGQIVAVSEHDRQSGNWKVMLPDSTKTVASGHARYGFSLVGLGRMPGTVLIGQDDGEQTLRELNLADGSLAELPYTHLIFSPTTRLLVGLVTGSEQWHTTMFDPILARHMQSVEKAFAGASLSFNSISTDQSKMVVYVDGAGTTGTWQLVDFNSKQAVPLADAYSGIPEDAVGSVQVVDYRASDGLAVKGILTLPYGRGTASHLPLVVLPHGGPESIDTVGFDWWAQAFASRGYAVFQPNFRGSAGHGAEFRNAGFGQWGRKMQTDISDGVADLAARGIIDPKRVCIVGASYGGYAALAAVTLQHGIYRCAASYAGVSDPGDMLQYTAKIYGPADKGSSMRYWRSYYGISENASHVPDEISPLAHAADADAPILLIHGRDDTVVPIGQSDAMESALKRAGKPVERVTLRGEDHWLSRSATRLQMLEAMMTFVQSHNPVDMQTAH